MTEDADLIRERDIDAALATASACRIEASRLKQQEFAPQYIEYLLQTAKGAQRWATKR